MGELDVQPLIDGTFTAPGDLFGDADLATHPAILDLDGRLRLPIGCFLVRSGERVVLIDAGVGPLHDDMFDGSPLLDALADVGDIDLVVCSHLHLDHCGWLIDRNAQPVFPSATLAVGADDWRYFVEDEAGFIRGSGVRRGELVRRRAATRRPTPAASTTSETIASAAGSAPVAGKVAGKEPRATTRNVVEARPDTSPTNVKVCSPSVSSARIVHVNLTTPWSLATCVPRLNGVESCSPDTVSPGWNPVPMPAC